MMKIRYRSKPKEIVVNKWNTIIVNDFIIS